jgi:hypothetical protein
MIDIILSTGTDGINELIRTYNVARSNDFVYDQIQIERRADQIEQRADQIEKRIDQIERADIIAEQDRLYQQSLDADIKKEQQKQAEREEQEVLDRRSAMTPQERRAMISASYDKVKKETPVEQNLHTIPQKQETDEEKRRHICAARLAALAKRI